MSRDSQVNSNDSEIDLFELISFFWEKKLVILASLILFAVLSIGYAFIISPVYQIKVGIIPPAISDIAEFNVGRDSKTDLEPYTIKKVYTVFTSHLVSNNLRNEFFNAVYLPSIDTVRDKRLSRDKIYSSFSKKLIVQPGKSQPGYYELMIEGGDPETLSKWAKKYIYNAEVYAFNEMLNNIKEESLVKAKDVNIKIKGLREIAEAQRKDRVAQIIEALNIAKSIGIERPPIISGQMENQLSAFMDGSLMYMRGIDALQAELKVLESRERNDPFIPGLRKLENLYKIYSNPQVDSNRVKMFRLDGEINPPDEPVKPNRQLIIAVGITLGFFVGVFIVLVLFVVKLKRLS